MDLSGRWFRIILDSRLLSALVPGTGWFFSSQNIPPSINRTYKVGVVRSAPTAEDISGNRHSGTDKAVFFGSQESKNWKLWMANAARYGCPSPYKNDLLVMANLWFVRRGSDVDNRVKILQDSLQSDRKTGIGGVYANDSQITVTLNFKVHGRGTGLVTCVAPERSFFDAASFFHAMYANTGITHELFHAHLITKIRDGKRIFGAETHSEGNSINAGQCREETEHEKRL